jgi:SAM-dependent methyltransferase
VTGLDLTRSRYDSAIRLTQLAKLTGVVDFRLGDALNMPFEDASFDIVIGQEAWCHVPDKARLIAECARVLKPGGAIAFTDILRRESLQAAELQRMQEAMAFPTLETLDGYSRLLSTGLRSWCSGSPCTGGSRPTPCASSAPSISANGTRPTRFSWGFSNKASWAGDASWRAN